MKKAVIGIIALLTAMIIVELAMRFIVGYPVEQERKHYLFLTDSKRFHHASMYAPYSEFWSVEGGCRKYRRNNVGLPGADIVVSDSSRYVFLAGSSFIEAYQVERDLTASSIFQRKLQQDVSSNLQVVNIGESRLDAFAAWFRVLLFSETYRPAKIVLAVEGFNPDWLDAYTDSLSFEVPDDFGKPMEMSLRFRISEVAVRYSSVLNLLRTLYWQGAPKNNDQPEERKDEVVTRMPDAFAACLLQFQTRYGDDFLVASFNNDAGANRELGQFCVHHGIHFRSTENILQPKYRFDGEGHLNLEGNRKLGEFLFEAFRETYSDE